MAIETKYTCDLCGGRADRGVCVPPGNDAVVSRRLTRNDAATAHICKPCIEAVAKYVAAVELKPGDVASPPDPDHKRAG